MGSTGNKPATRSGAHSRTRQKPASAPTVDTSVYTSLFVGSVLAMSWQLALVVIVPIVGGYTLDQRFGWSPLLTLAGLVVAAAGTVVVLWRTVRRANAHVSELQMKGRR